MMINCEFCDSINVEITNTKEIVTETCRDCGQSIQYDRIMIGRKGKASYIEAVFYAFRKQDNKVKKVLLTAVGTRISTLVSIFYDMKSIVEPVSWDVCKTELKGKELRILVRKKEGERK